MTNLTLPIFTDANKAREHLESIRWPDGPVCAHCGSVNEATLLKGKSHRPGMYQCNACREPFSVTVGTVMERSHIPLNKWVLGFHLMAASKKGISAHQLHRMLGVTYKSAWFMAHRIREAMKPARRSEPMGGGGGFVEVDETYFGHRPGYPVTYGVAHKYTIVSLVEREGRARSFYMPELRGRDMHDVIKHYVSPKAHLRTDESQLYSGIKKHVTSHETVNHSKGEYVRGDASSNSVEGAFSIFKRGMIGTYQHCGEAHLHRYLTEFDFRYSNRAALGVDDALRAERAIKGAEGKRLTYHVVSG